MFATVDGVLCGVILDMHVKDYAYLKCVLLNNTFAKIG